MDGAPSTGQLFPVQPAPQTVVIPDPLIRYPMIGRDLNSFMYGWNKETIQPRYPVYQHQVMVHVPVMHTQNPSYSRVERAKQARDKYLANQRTQRTAAHARPQPQPQERSTNPLMHPFFDGFKPVVFADPGVLPAWARW
jgi:hypothetical protein